MVHSSGKTTRAFRRRVKRGCTGLNPVLKPTRDPFLEGPEKPLKNFKPYDFRAVLFTYS